MWMRMTYSLGLGCKPMSPPGIAPGASRFPVVFSNAGRAFYIVTTGTRFYIDE